MQFGVQKAHFVYGWPPVCNFFLIYCSDFLKLKVREHEVIISHFYERSHEDCKLVQNVMNDGFGSLFGWRKVQLKLDIFLGLSFTHGFSWF